MSTHNEIVFFDFDGVIVDSFGIAYDTLRSFHPHISEEEYRGWFEGNIYDHSLKSNLKKEEIVSKHRWFKTFAPKLRGLVPIPGIDRALAEIGRPGRESIIVSSTTSDLIREFLERHGLHGHFTDVLGGDVHEGKQEKFKMGLEASGVSPHQSILVTDTVGDIKEATAVGIPSLGVSWGFHDKELLLRESPIAVVEDISLLGKTIEDALRQRKGLL